MSDLWATHLAIHDSIKTWYSNSSIKPADIQPILTWNLMGSPAVCVGLPTLMPDMRTEEGELYRIDIWISAIHDGVQVSESEAVRQVVKLMQSLAEWFSAIGRFGSADWQQIAWRKHAEWMRIRQEPNRKAVRVRLDIVP